MYLCSPFSPVSQATSGVYSAWDKRSGEEKLRICSRSTPSLCSFFLPLTRRCDSALCLQSLDFPICRLKLSDGLCFQTQDNYTLNGQGCPVARNLGCTLPLVSEAGLGGCSPTCGLGRQYSVLIQHSPHLPGTESFLGNLYA